MPTMELLVNVDESKFEGCRVSSLAKLFKVRIYSYVMNVNFPACFLVKPYDVCEIKKVIGRTKVKRGMVLFVSGALGNILHLKHHLPRCVSFSYKCHNSGCQADSWAHSHSPVYRRKDA